MCGLAGIIHRDGPSDLGTEITTMLQSMKHRGPDSTGYALYGQPDDLIVVRFVLAEPREYGGFGVEERLERSRAEVESRLAKIGAEYVLRWLPRGLPRWLPRCGACVARLAAAEPGGARGAAPPRLHP